MEQLEHGLRGNCLFLWPAAKGEEVNGKRYESVCPLRWWIRFKLEEEGLSICSALAFPILTTLNCFLSFALQPIRAALIFFLNLSFSFSSISYAPLPPNAALQQGSGAVRVDRLSSGRSRGQGQHLQIAGQKAETARPSVRTQCAAGIARPCRVTGSHDLEPWAEKKINTNPLSLVVGLQASVPRVCVHSLAYGVLLKMD